LRYVLDRYVKEDPRVLEVYVEAKRRYAGMALPQHNFHHVLRDLHRALIIAGSEEPVKYSVLIPSVLLHDIGFSAPEFKKEGHDVVGARIGREILRSLGFDEPTCDAVCHCIRSHKGKAELPETIEAKIVYDADVLEKAGVVALIYGGKIICEFGETLDEYLRKEIEDRRREIARGFYTAKARAMDNGSLAKFLGLLLEDQEETARTRPDVVVSENDLWADRSAHSPFLPVNGDVAGP
jgi:HD superfamily phosphodiesterase